MKSSEWSSLDSALARLEGLPEDARIADGVITTHLRQKFAQLLVDEHRRRSGAGEDEGAITLWANQMTSRVVLDPQSLYRLFELQMKGELTEFWQRLDITEPGLSRGEKAGPAQQQIEEAHWNLREGRRFHCAEGCEFVGEDLYLSHRDRGHHPVPI